MKHKRMSALLLALIMLFTFLTGCGKTDEGSDTGLLEKIGESGSDSRQADGMAMGRYLEERISLGNSIDWYGCGLHKLADGRIVISNKYSPFLISDDNGMTWKEDNREWHAEMIREGRYASEIAVGPDNTAAVIYNDDSYDKEERQYTGNPRLLVIRPDGTENLIDIPKGGGNRYPRKVKIADNGRIFVSISGSSDLYEVKDDGSCEYYMTIQGESPELMQFRGNLMFLDVSDSKYPLIYDMDKNEYIEDDVLNDFIQENYPDGNSYNGTGTFQMYFFPGEEGVIYIAGKKGLHRHVIGGSAMEQVIDGSRCTLSDPSYGIREMVMLADNAFLTLFSSDGLGNSGRGGFASIGDDGRLVRYIYDSDVAAVPADKLKVYSLRENDTIRQAIALFLTAEPDVEVEYVIGMEEGSSITREDALKKLNTEIMAGQGPDVLLLDDMPLVAYMEKGVLMDLSTILESLDGEEAIFNSIVQAMKQDGHVYTMPCEIQIPVIMGEEKYISQLKDLESAASMMEELRRDYPGRDILHICTEKGIMRYFAMSCVPAWTTESGELDREAIAQFLKQTKRIYDAQMDGLPEETIAEYHRSNEIHLENQGESRDDSADLRADDNVVNYVGGFVQLTGTALSNAGVYDKMVSVNKVKGFEASKWTVMNGQSSNVFCAKTLLGITATSKNSDSAEKFIMLCLGRENQSNLFYGLAVNRAAFDDKFIVEDTTERFMWSKSDVDGNELMIPVDPSSEEQIAALRKCIESADTPYIEDSVLENVVYEEGILYMQGKQSLEEAVNEIEKRISIYLAE